MKRIMLLLMLSMFFMGSLTINGYARVMPVSIMPIQENTCEYKGMTLRIPVGKINNVVWTGKEYIYECKYVDPDTGALFMESTDFQNWEPLINDGDLRDVLGSSKSTYLVKYWGGKYIVQNRANETSMNIVGALEHNQKPTGYPIYILDENFNILNRTAFEQPVTGIRYVNGKYYCQTQDYRKVLYRGGKPENVIYVSEDGINWEREEGLTEIPLKNDLGNMLFFDGIYSSGKGYQRSITQLARNNDMNSRSNVVFEKELFPYYDVIEDLYLSVDRWEETNYFSISWDGVYWILVELPALENNNEIKEWLNLYPSLLIRTRDFVIEYDINDLRAELSNCVGDQPIYVELNNTVLGFEQSPIMEDDRTLVPMRFLFEQLGADVDWNQETQTATATLGNQAVAFSIDDTDASVNNAPITMDVPARLINDKTMVPLRFLSENLGYTVSWDGENRIATIE